MAIAVRLGEQGDVDGAVSVYLRSNLVRRQGRPIPPSRIDEVTATLRDPATWFVVAGDGPTLVGMASAKPARRDLGAGPVIPGACYLDLLFVLPERWGQGIGGVILDAVVDEARGRDYASIQLWTHEDNERSHRLYRSRRFSPTGVRRAGGDGGPVAEWGRHL